MSRKDPNHRPHGSPQPPEQSRQDRRQRIETERRADKALKANAIRQLIEAKPMMTKRADKEAVGMNLWEILRDAEDNFRVTRAQICREAGLGGESDSTKRLYRYALNPTMDADARKRRADSLTQKIRKYVRITDKIAVLTGQDPDELRIKLVRGSTYADDNDLQVTEADDYIDFFQTVFQRYSLFVRDDTNIDDYFSYLTSVPYYLANSEGSFSLDYYVEDLHRENINDGDVLSSYQHNWLPKVLLYQIPVKTDVAIISFPKTNTKRAPILYKSPPKTWNYELITISSFQEVHIGFAPVGPNQEPQLSFFTSVVHHFASTLKSVNVDVKGQDDHFQCTNSRSSIYKLLKLKDRIQKCYNPVEILHQDAFHCPSYEDLKPLIFQRGTDPTQKTSAKEYRRYDDDIISLWRGHVLDWPNEKIHITEISEWRPISIIRYGEQQEGLGAALCSYEERSFMLTETVKESTHHFEVGDNLLVEELSPSSLKKHISRYVSPLNWFEPVVLSAPAWCEVVEYYEGTNYSLSGFIGMSYSHTGLPERYRVDYSPFNTLAFFLEINISQDRDRTTGHSQNILDMLAQNVRHRCKLLLEYREQKKRLGNRKISEIIERLYKRSSK